jgi:hypothetical protein
VAPQDYNFSLYCYLLLLCKNGTFHNFGIWLQLQYSSTETLEVDLFSALHSRSVSLWNTQTWKSMYTEMWCQISASSYWPLTGVHGSWLHWFGSLPSCWGNCQKTPKISHCLPSISSLQASSISFMASCNTSNSHHNQAPSSITPSCFLPMTNEPNFTVNYENIYSDCILAWQMCHQSYIGTILYQITATLILASDYGHQLYDRVPLKKWFQWRARQKYEAGRQITLAKRVT